MPDSLLSMASLNALPSDRQKLPDTTALPTKVLRPRFDSFHFQHDHLSRLLDPGTLRPLPPLDIETFIFFLNFLNLSELNVNSTAFGHNQLRVNGAELPSRDA
jgi:hypothetical protein